MSLNFETFYIKLQCSDSFLSYIVKNNSRSVFLEVYYISKVSHTSALLLSSPTPRFHTLNPGSRVAAMSYSNADLPTMTRKQLQEAAKKKVRRGVKSAAPIANFITLWRNSGKPTLSCTDEEVGARSLKPNPLFVVLGSSATK